MTTEAKTENVSQEEAIKRIEVLRRWSNAGLGNLPLPESPEQYAALPLSNRLALEKHDPELARMLAPLVPLPARTELRLAEGQIDAFGPEDVEPLLAAGHTEIVEQLRQRYLDNLWATREKNAAEEVKVMDEWRAGAEERRLQSLEAHNAKLRLHAISRMQQGLPPAPMLR